LLESITENIPTTDLNNRAGQTINVTYGATNINYNVITTFYGNDLATDLNPARGNQIVSFGLVLQAPNNDVVIAIRGTDGIWEWIHDAEFLQVPCPFLAGAGNTEDGFTALYKSLRMTTNLTSTTLVNALPTLPFNQPIGSVTVIGHSLGGALATLLALDMAANTTFKSPIVYTYASPRTGDTTFANKYNSVVPNTARIANLVDIIPKLPTPPLYDHVMGLFQLTTIVLIPLPPKILVQLDPGCQHYITTYVYLLSRQGGGTVLPLDANCTPP
jgi:hypothetical protein